MQMKLLCKRSWPALFLLLWLVSDASCREPAQEKSPPGAPATGQPPVLYLIGDSTVKNGRGDGASGMWGWGQVLPEHFDTQQITVENRALGGRSSRTYLTEGLWEKVLQQLRPGDFVVMQFGHNDGGQMFDSDRPRASIKGNGDETREGTVIATGKHEVVHSYGWYLRKYVADAKSRGATPIVLSLVPRDIWHDGRVIRASNDYGKWASEAARDSGAAFVDLNSLVADRYEAAGQEQVHEQYFTPQDHTHTSKAGAEVNAACVADGIRVMDDCGLKDFLKPVDEQAPGNETEPTSLRFDFGPGKKAEGYKRVLATDAFNEEKGYGFERSRRVRDRSEGSSPDALEGDACVSDSPFYFSMMLPEGNYRVRALFAESSPHKPVVVKAELRLLLASSDGENQSEFIVNVRTPTMSDGCRVGLKAREAADEKWAWDNRLTLEFNGERPSIACLVVTPAPEATTVFLVGDSTVADQPYEPWNSWGQMLPSFFDAQVAVANHSESGESIKSSLAARRFDKIFDAIKPGDYLFIQFGHNDMKDPAADSLRVYRENLRRLVVQTRQRGATPVLVTSMERKTGLVADTLGGYPQAVREVAEELDAPLIDLHAMSKALYRSLGPNLDRAFVDGTHHNDYGSYQLARCVVAGIRDQALDLTSHLKKVPPPIDLRRSGPVNDWRIP